MATIGHDVLSIFPVNEQVTQILWQDKGTTYMNSVKNIKTTKTAPFNISSSQSNRVLEVFEE
ncbi:hypothetical protein Glove_109g283 [Diversispora epigaea]|uniref:Uncharacterized protein n=1 Tax=Diversispora epigaea TaxID=1348612 RepID=A0A397J6I5_9GLOM|nr:hypothetical protein Glove_109g283 [Diversispora epigaea]